MRRRDLARGRFVRRRRGANQNVLYVLAAIMLVAGAALIVIKNRESKPAENGPQPVAPATVDKTSGDTGGASAGKGAVNADLRALFVSAKRAYKAFGEAERAGDETARLRNFKQAKAMLEAFMEKAGAAEGEATGMIREAQQMLSDLTKRARTSD